MVIGECALIIKTSKEVTMKDKFAIPMTDELLDEITKACFFTS